MLKICFVKQEVTMGSETPTPSELPDLPGGQEETLREPTGSTQEKSLGEREGMFSRVRYRALKVKEHFGRLSPEEFEELLSLDFQAHLKENPPIGETFSPEEELVKLRSLPKEERREALKVFKQRWATQRRAWGECKRFIERSIEFNPDVPRDTLVGLIDQFGGYYGFSRKQRKIAEQLIDAYYEHRRRVLELREKYQDDIELVRELTGVDLDKDADVRVTVGPMMIIIETDGRNAGRLYYKLRNTSAPFGYAGITRSFRSVYYVVINRDWWVKWIRYADPTGKRARRHEYEHLKYVLFRRVFESQVGKKDGVGLYWRYIDEKDPEIKRAILEDYFRAERARALEQVKGEIAACLPERYLWELRLKLDLFFKEGTPYDYLYHVRGYGLTSGDRLYQELSQKMLVEEYRDIVEKAVKALVRLKKEGKYSASEAVTLLIDKPLTQWPKTVRRLLEQGKE